MSKQKKGGKTFRLLLIYHVQVFFSILFFGENCACSQPALCVCVCVARSCDFMYMFHSACVCVCVCVGAQVRRGRRRKSVKTVPPVPAKKGSVVTLETIIVGLVG